MLKPLRCVGFLLLLCLPRAASAIVVVTVNASNLLAVVSAEALGLHTSVYDNQNGNANLPGRLQESGVSALRYPGGGYADVFHWSIAQSMRGTGIPGGGMSPWLRDEYHMPYMGAGADFGSFIRLLDRTGDIPAILTVNYGTALKVVGDQTVVPDFGGQPKEAAAWVAYANGDAGAYKTTNDLLIGVDQQGNDWHTTGYWARLRASTGEQYKSWAGADGVYNSSNTFLAINRVAPVGIKYWEIGNETFGSGYYERADTVVTGSTGYSENLFGSLGADRRGQPGLSPAFYGRQVNQFAAAMKAVDPGIKIGVVLTTPPDDYGWDYYPRFKLDAPYSQILGPDSPAVKHWNPEVLAQCASNIDFVIAHWYADAGSNTDGSNLLAAVGASLPGMINGNSDRLDPGAAAGLRDWINRFRPADGSNVQIFITEFGYKGSLAGSLQGPASSLFAADAYATWMELGVANVDYLEMNSPAFLGDAPSLTRGAVFYAVQLLRTMVAAGDVLVHADSGHGSLRAHAALRRDGRLGLLLLNEDPAHSQIVSVSVSNICLASTALESQFGLANFPAGNPTPSSGPSTSTLSGLGNSFTLTVPAYTMIELLLPTVNNTAAMSTQAAHWHAAIH